MTLREFFRDRLQGELPVFMNVLKAIPEDKLGYKPHDRSPSTQDVVWTLTRDLESCVGVVSEHKAAWADSPAPRLAEMLDRFERAANEVADRVSKMDESAWNRPAQFFYGGKMVMEEPAGTFLWFVLFDAIHHRGQLTTYLRPMGAKVPQVYGPSGDEPMGGSAS